MNELEVKLLDDEDGEIWDGTVEVAIQVEFHWKGLVRDTLLPNYAPDRGGYWTGAYHDSIHREAVRGRRPKGSKNKAGRNVGGQFVYHHRVVTFSEIANLLEYGTGPDHAPNYPGPPNNGGHWRDQKGELHFHWNTPTPAFAFAADTEMSFT